MGAQDNRQPEWYCAPPNTNGSIFFAAAGGLRTPPTMAPVGGDGAGGAAWACRAAPGGGGRPTDATRAGSPFNRATRCAPTTRHHIPNPHHMLTHPPPHRASIVRVIRRAWGVGAPIDGLHEQFDLQMRGKLAITPTGVERADDDGADVAEEEDEGVAEELVPEEDLCWMITSSTTGCPATTPAAGASHVARCRT